MKRNFLSLGIIFLFILSAISPIVISNIIKTSNEEKNVHEFTFERYLYPEFYDSYNTDEITIAEGQSNNDVVEDLIIDVPEEPVQSLVGPMDSAWSMHGHDVRHTGLSHYLTTDTSNVEKWRFKTDDWATSSPVIDDNDIIYIGSSDFYAIYPNGTLKWRYDTRGVIEHTSPVIDENGVIYVPTAHVGVCLYAIYTNNGTLKWKYHVGNLITSSPAIDNNIIYFGDWNGDIHALYLNGTRKWIFHTNDVITSSPAIGFEGTIIIGSHDGYIYALYPNGTLKWRYNTGSWVHGIPTIADDGTVYCGSDNGYMYAFYPDNGTVKWTCKIGAVWGSPALDKDSILYIGVWDEKFYALYPNGTIKWTFNADEKIWSSSACISENGNIYFGTCDLEDEGGLDMVALNYNGTLRWRKHIGSLYSSPAIGENGDVYIGASTTTCGYLYTFGELEPDAPSAPTIIGQISGTIETEYVYTFKSVSPLGRDVYYYIEWGDGSKKDWFGPFNSGEEATASHTWTNQGTYTIKARVKDTDNLWGPGGELKVTMPRDKSTSTSPLLRFLERYPLIQKLLLIK